MTTLDKLVQAAAEAMCATAPEDEYEYAMVRSLPIARKALAAAFAALPKCEEAVEVAGWSFPSDWLVDDYHAEIGKRALVALARKFGEET